MSAMRHLHILILQSYGRCRPAPSDEESQTTGP